MAAPTTPAGVADVLREASERRQSVLIRGAGTKLDWGRPAGRVDIVLDMQGLNRVIAHEPGDLTATFEAGVSLQSANAALVPHAQALPLDPSFSDRATIGGLLATNDSGSLRHRYGTPRDLVIGVGIATTDGTLAKAGGKVVKNVAGYDLGRLMAGSFGSLAAIVSATFKLAPLPATSKTLAVSAPDGDALGDLVRRMMSSQIEAQAFDVAASLDRASLYLRFASVPVVVDGQLDQARRLLGGNGASLDVLEGGNEQALWHDHQAAVWSGSGCVIRASWLPARLPAVLRELRTLEVPFQLVGRAAVGAGFIQFDADVTALARAVARLRESPAVGHVVLLRGADALKAAIDPWGSMGDREPLFASLKRALDPHNTLNAGRGPL
jgi:glycolate oxidase FAD binding subunit